jgi:hypothetical protein
VRLVRLYDWWERIDSWISQNRPADAAVPEGAEVREVVPVSDEDSPVPETGL